MKTAKKCLVTLIVCLLAVLILWLICFFFSKPWYYRLFYPRDRYTGTVTVEMDGEPAVFTVKDRHRRRQAVSDVTRQNAAI